MSMSPTRNVKLLANYCDGTSIVMAQVLIRIPVTVQSAPLLWGPVSCHGARLFESATSKFAVDCDTGFRS